MAQPFSPPPYNNPLSVPSGLLSYAWSTWFRQLFQLVGSLNTSAVTAKSASYKILATDGAVIFSGMSSAQTATLPTAVGVSGKTYAINNNDTTYALSLATTSAQTIGGRASANIVLAPAVGDFIQIFSDGANWQIIGKKETAFLSGTGSHGSMTSSSAIWLSGSASVPLTPGTWRLGGTVAADETSGALGFITLDGAFATADGTNTSSTPAFTVPFSGGINGLSGVLQLTQPGTTGGTNAVVTMPALVVTVTSNTTIYLVPLAAVSVASTNCASNIIAERVW